MSVQRIELAPFPAYTEHEGIFKGRIDDNLNSHLFATILLAQLKCFLCSVTILCVDSIGNILSGLSIHFNEASECRPGRDGR